MTTRSTPVTRGAWRASALVLAFLCAGLLGARSSAQGRSDVRLPGHIPPAGLGARKVAAVAPQERVELALTLPLRNEAELEALIPRLYNPRDPLYGHYLSSGEFQARYCPTEGQYEAVAALARERGLAITARHANRLLLEVSGTAAVVERAFNTRLSRFQAANGQVFRAPEAEPAVPGVLAGTLNGVVGLDDLGIRRPHLLRKSAQAPGRTPRVVGTGPGGGMVPADIKNAYNLAGTPLTGAGQVLAVFELDTYNPTDITTYEDQWGLPHVPLQDTVMSGAATVPGSGQDEVTLDIELQIALAPGASKIRVYQGKNTDAGVLAAYSQIAEDNDAKSISTSWGLAENRSARSAINGEAAIFKQMAAQGQSIFAASGDAGAFDDGHRISVDDPASQPFMTGVGGTRLFTNGLGGTWQMETTWNDGSADAGGSGGGISTVWPLPSYQSGVITAASHGSATKRNVPDVSLNAEPDSGYSIFTQGQWAIFGGTSCAAPLWAAFAALVNEQRAANGDAPVGFMNPQLYELGKTKGTIDFHDIADGSTNLAFAAVPGYDCATGWGTLNGANLLADLTGSGNTGGQGPHLTNTSVTTRNLPSSGGSVGVSVDVASSTALRQVVINVVSPRNSTTSTALTIGPGSTYSGTVTIPANRNTTVATYRLSVSATDNLGTTNSVDCGTVTVAARDIAAPSFGPCSLSPTALTSAGGNVLITANVTDASGVGSVVATITRSGKSSTLTLTGDGTGNFSGTYVAPANTTASAQKSTVTLRATDTLGNAAARTCGTVTVAAGDTKAPTVSHGKVTPTSLPATGGTVTISATATDNVAVTGVSASIAKPGGGTDTVPLTHGTGNTYSATYVIPANTTTSTQKYTVSVTASDTSNNKRTVKCGTVSVNRP